MSTVTMDHTGVGVVCLWLSVAMCVVHGQSHYVNVALNKTYNQSSTFDTQGPSSNAANGDTSGVYSYTNCIHTNPNDRNSWWEVDLGRTYPVYNMDVWARDGFKDRLYSNISVDGQWCASITSFPTNTRKKEVTCPTIMYGRTVRVTRLTYTGNEPAGHTLNLCEVQIWDCQAGWYGKQCNTACSEGCKDLVCDRHTGQQTGICSECKPRFYGPNCTKMCQHQCLNNTCIKDSGLCEACPGNFRGIKCSECKPGLYGVACDDSCQHQCLNNTCIRDSGLCEACPGNFHGNTCSECKVGFHGESCNLQCQHQCLNNECIKDSGLCEHCPGNYQGNTCSAPNNDETANTPAIIGAVVGTGLFLCVCIIVLSVVMWFRRSRDSALRKRNEVNEMDTSVPPTSSRPASTADRGQTSAVSQGTEDGPEHYEPVDMSEQNERVDYELVDMAEAENGVHSDDLTVTSHKTEADSANPYDTPAVQYHNTGDVHLYDTWGNPQAFQ